MNVPVSYIVLKLGGVPETILYVAIFISVLCLCARLYMLRIGIHLNIRLFVVKVLFNILIVSIISAIIPISLQLIMKENFMSFVLISSVCLISTAFSIFFIGCNKSERKFVTVKTVQLKQRLLSR